MTFSSRYRLPALPVHGTALLVLGLIAALSFGCGPVQSTSEISSAEASLERARVNDAEDYSPYEYQRAQHFLYKAKQEWGYSNFETSRDFAIEARRAADAAIDNAQEAPWQGHPIYGAYGEDNQPEEVERMQREIEETDDLDELERLDEIEEFDD